FGHHLSWSPPAPNIFHRRRSWLDRLPHFPRIMFETGSDQSAGGDHVEIIELFWSPPCSAGGDQRGKVVTRGPRDNEKGAPEAPSTLLAASLCDRQRR